MISNTVIVLLIGVFIISSGNTDDSDRIFMCVALLIAVFFDWFNICMTLNKDKRESE